MLAQPGQATNLAQPLWSIQAPNLHLIFQRARARKSQAKPFRGAKECFFSQSCSSCYLPWFAPFTALLGCFPASLSTKGCCSSRPVLIPFILPRNARPFAGETWSIFLAANSPFECQTGTYKQWIRVKKCLLLQSCFSCYLQRFAPFRVMCSVFASFLFGAGELLGSWRGPI